MESVLNFTLLQLGPIFLLSNRFQSLSPNSRRDLARYERRTGKHSCIVVNLDILHPEVFPIDRSTEETYQ
jgi:hypothetical protein